MIMKSLIPIILACIICIPLKAQNGESDSVIIVNEDTCSTESIQAAIDACVMLANAAATKDLDALSIAKDSMEKCNIAEFDALIRQHGNEHETLNGHLVFNTAFADSLIQGKDPYKKADTITKATSDRGQMQPGQILTKTCFVKAKGKSVYIFPTSNRQELAVVAEPGGLITTRVHAVNKAKGINEWHNDTVDVTKGRNSRKTAFTLPPNPISQVTLEITNCTNKDITVVVISN